MTLVVCRIGKEHSKNDLPIFVMSVGLSGEDSRVGPLEQLKLKESHPGWFHVTTIWPSELKRLKSVLPACGDLSDSLAGPSGFHRTARAPRTSCPS